VVSVLRTAGTKGHPRGVPCRRWVKRLAPSPVCGRGRRAKRGG